MPRSKQTRNVQSAKPAQTNKRPPKASKKKHGKTDKLLDDTNRKLSYLSVAAQPTTYSAMFSNPTSSSSEIHYKGSIYFDIGSTDADTTGYVRQLQIGTVQRFVRPRQGSSNISRLRKVNFYALPRFDNANVSDVTIMTLFGVPVLVNGEAATGAGPKNALVGQKSTLLTPSSVSDWVHIGTWKESMFKDAIYTPAILNNTVEQAYVAGSLTVINPDTGNFIASNIIQIRADVTISETVPMAAVMRGNTPFAATTNANPDIAYEGVLEGIIGDIPAFVQPTGMTKIF